MIHQFSLNIQSFKISMALHLQRSEFTLSSALSHWGDLQLIIPIIELHGLGLKCARFATGKRKKKPKTLTHHILRFQMQKHLLESYFAGWGYEYGSLQLISTALGVTGANGNYTKRVSEDKGVIQPALKKSTKQKPNFFLFFYFQPPTPSFLTFEPFALLSVLSEVEASTFPCWLNFKTNAILSNNFYHH